ncbi:Protein eva-1 C [Merluccius polli]|uniref:Protein eva-1 C n=1 Tax=Merluccius polli TaxID=89951 RepID=A0AA47M3U2_MERPO|nr:Protein eva-1 C [Merluccius polli]
MMVSWSLYKCGCLLGLLVALNNHTAQSAPDFSMYLHTVLKNHTAHACEGDILTIKCPSRTSIAVLSAFYGRRVPSQHVCPSPPGTNATLGEEDAECTSLVAIEKVLSECQDQHFCHIPVVSPVFGQDPCPFTSKYLLVSYKCRPVHHRTRLVCENERMRITCKNDTVIAVYSASFGHQVDGSPNCPQEPTALTELECLSPSALRKVSRRCHGRANCSVIADTHTFGDPCFPGIRKHLRVSFTCVPRFLLEETGRGTTDPFRISDYTHGFPEKVALFFVSGICTGLLLLLCLFGVRSTLIKDVKELVGELGEDYRASRKRRRGLMEDLYDDDVSDTSSFCRLTQSYRAADMLSAPTTTVEMVEREVRETREPGPNGDMWPHRDSVPHAIHKIKTYNS